MQSVPITTYIVSTNPAHGEVHLIQHYVIKSGGLQREVHLIQHYVIKSGGLQRKVCRDQKGNQKPLIKEGQ